MAETFGYSPNWMHELGPLPHQPSTLEGTLAAIPGLGSYIAYGQYLDAQKQRQQALKDQEAFRAERGVLGPGATPEDMFRVGARYSTPADLMGKSDEWAKLIEAKKTREAMQAGLDQIYGTQPTAQSGQPAELGIGQPVGGAPEAPASPDPQARIAQLKQTLRLYAGNPAYVSAINREIDKLETAAKPLIEHNYPIGGNKVQPHISYDSGRTWQPIPGSQSSDKFNPSTNQPFPRQLPEQLYKDYANHPQVKDANDLEQKMAPLTDYMIQFKKTGKSINANDAALAKAYLAVTTSLGNRAYAVDNKALAGLPNLGDRLGNMASSFFSGKDLTDQTRSEMFNYIVARYRQLDSTRQDQKALTVRRGAARGVTAEQIFGKEAD